MRRCQLLQREHPAAHATQTAEPGNAPLSAMGCALAWQPPPPRDRCPAAKAAAGPHLSIGTLTLPWAMRSAMSCRPLSAPTSCSSLRQQGRRRADVHRPCQAQTKQGGPTRAGPGLGGLPSALNSLCASMCSCLALQWQHTEHACAAAVQARGRRVVASGCRPAAALTGSRRSGRACS